MKKKIIALCLSALFVAFTLTACGSTGATEKTTTTLTKTETTAEKESSRNEPVYSKGVVKNNVYRNDWLNIMLELPDGYRNADEDFYQRIEEEGGDDCGMYFVSDQSRATVVLSFADLSGHANVTEDVFLSTASELISEQMANYGTVSTVGDVGNCTVASKSFRVLHLDCVVNEVEYTQSLLAYRIGEKMCYIIITGDSVEANLDMASRFSTL